jgi:uncharacterized protein (TIGR00369 family)
VAVNPVNSIAEIREIFEKSPFLNHMGVQIAEFEEGHVKLELPIGPSLINVNDTVHGGVHAGLLDAVLGMTIRSLTKCPLVTVNLTIHYFAPVQDGSMIATAKVIHQGYRLITGEGEIIDKNGNLIAKGTGTFKVMHNPKR